jgi:hypothetical protein
MEMSPVSEAGFGRQLNASADKASDIALRNTIRREIAFRKRNYPPPLIGYQSWGQH